MKRNVQLIYRMLKKTQRKEKKHNYLKFQTNNVCKKLQVKAKTFQLFFKIKNNLSLQKNYQTSRLKFKQSPVFIKIENTTPRYKQLLARLFQQSKYFAVAYPLAGYLSLSTNPQHRLVGLSLKTTNVPVCEIARKKQVTTTYGNPTTTYTIYLLWRNKVVGVINFFFTQHYKQNSKRTVIKPKWSTLLTDFTSNSVFIANSRRVLGVTKSVSQPLELYLQISSLELSVDTDPFSVVKLSEQVRLEKTPRTTTHTCEPTWNVFLNKKIWRFAKYSKQIPGNKVLHALRVAKKLNKYLAKRIDLLEHRERIMRYVGNKTKFARVIRFKSITSDVYNLWRRTGGQLMSNRRALIKTLETSSKKLLSFRTDSSRNVVESPLLRRIVAQPPYRISELNIPQKFQPFNLQLHEVNAVLARLFFNTFCTFLMYFSIVRQLPLKADPANLNLVNRGPKSKNGRITPAVFYKLMFHFKKHYLHVTLLDRKKGSSNIYFSLNTGLFLKFFNYKKSLKKSKSLKMLLMRYLRKLLIVSKINNFYLYVKHTSDQLNKLIQILQKPLNHSFTDPLTSTIIDEETLKTPYAPFNFVYIIFLKNKPYGKMKIKNAGRLKRKIQRRIMKVNRIID